MRGATAQLFWFVVLPTARASCPNKSAVATHQPSLSTARARQSQP